jgi:hypothetical protein
MKSLKEKGEIKSFGTILVLMFFFLALVAVFFMKIVLPLLFPRLDKIE